jgi:cbb3-type cytochrome c oxidase subunit III
MKRLIPKRARWRVSTVALAVVLSVVLFGALALVPAAVAQEGHDDQGKADDLAAIRGAAVYAEFCQACHGETGQGRGHAAVFVGITYDPAEEASAREVIAKGRDSDEADDAAMPAFDRLLDDEQIDDVLAYMATWAQGEVPALPEPNLHEVVASVPGYAGDPLSGAEVYAKSCYGCHGEQGQGRGGRDFPGFEVNDTTMDVVRNGTDHPVMPGWSPEAGGPMTEAQLDDLEAYLASWPSAPVDEAGEDEGIQGLNYVLVIVGAVMIAFVGGVYHLGTRREMRRNAQQE